ncbi:hypothetical protein EDB84DRAFT_1433794 [Lactarius hengduanensis]|nr:hypothetical protein EDB84DRAFT_1433794 [Lactarius hengduanensis]
MYIARHRLRGCRGLHWGDVAGSWRAMLGRGGGELAGGAVVRTVSWGLVVAGLRAVLRWRGVLAGSCATWHDVAGSWRAVLGRGGGESAGVAVMLRRACARQAAMGGCGDLPQCPWWICGQGVGGACARWIGVVITGLSRGMGELAMCGGFVAGLQSRGLGGGGVGVLEGPEKIGVAVAAPGLSMAMGVVRVQRQGARAAVEAMVVRGAASEWQ